MSFAEPIWASGHVAAYIGRTHDRFRTAINPCKCHLNSAGRPRMELARAEQVPRGLGGMTMIDHPEQVERLMERLGAALPIPARLTPEIQMTLRQQRGVTVPTNCSVTWISYAGDDGGIVCRLEAAAETAEAVFASITHLRFDPRLPVTREIVAYQKHRVKRLRLQPQ
jgi:hypothetical protein